MRIWLTYPRGIHHIYPDVWPYLIVKILCQLHVLVLLKSMYFMEFTSRSVAMPGVGICLEGSRDPLGFWVCPLGPLDIRYLYVEKFPIELVKMYFFYLFGRLLMKFPLGSMCKAFDEMICELTIKPCNLGGPYFWTKRGLTNSTSWRLAVQIGWSVNPKNGNILDLIILQFWLPEGTGPRFMIFSLGQVGDHFVICSPCFSALSERGSTYEAAGRCTQRIWQVGLGCGISGLPASLSLRTGWIWRVMVWIPMGSYWHWTGGFHAGFPWFFFGLKSHTSFSEQEKATHESLLSLTSCTGWSHWLISPDSGTAFREAKAAKAWEENPGSGLLLSSHQDTWRFPNMG